MPAPGHVATVAGITDSGDPWCTGQSLVTILTISGLMGSDPGLLGELTIASIVCP